MTANDVARVEQKLAERLTPATTGQLRVGSTGLAIRDMTQLLDFAKIMAIGGISVPKHLRGNPGACIAVTLQAIEWEMSPFAVANKSYSVNDRLAYEAQLLHAVLLKRAPIRGRPMFAYEGEGAKRRCKVSVKLLEDGQVVDYTTPPIGEIPTKNSPLWKSDPDQQLGYYAVRSLARRHFPDTLLGVVEREEARYAAIDGEIAEPEQAPETRRKGIDERLAGLASAQADRVDPDTGEVLDADVAEEAPTLPDEPEEAVGDAPQGPDEPSEDHLVDPALLAAARKGPKSLKLALGRLAIEEFEAIPTNIMTYLHNVAKMANMKTGESQVYGD